MIESMIILIIRRQLMINLEMQHDGELKYNKDMALFIKHEMEKKFMGSWHIIVGKSLHFKVI